MRNPEWALKVAIAKAKTLLTEEAIKTWKVRMAVWSVTWRAGLRQRCGIRKWG